MSDFEAIFTDKATVEVNYKGAIFHITYNPGLWSTRWHMRLSDRTDNITFKEMVDNLLKVLVDWDLTRGGKPWPVDEKSLKTLPQDGLVAIHMAIASRESGPPIEGSEGKDIQAGTS